MAGWQGYGYAVSTVRTTRAGKRIPQSHIFDLISSARYFLFQFRWRHVFYPKFMIPYVLCQ